MFTRKLSIRVKPEMLAEFTSRAEYLWLGALGGVALILTPLNLALTVTGPFWPDVICVAVFVAYYKLCIAGSRMSVPSRGGQGGGQRAR